MRGPIANPCDAAALLLASVLCVSLQVYVLNLSLGKYCHTVSPRVGQSRGLFRSADTGPRHRGCAHFGGGDFRIGSLGGWRGICPPASSWGDSLLEDLKHLRRKEGPMAKNDVHAAYGSSSAVSPLLWIDDLFLPIYGLHLLPWSSPNPSTEAVDEVRRFFLFVDLGKK